MQEEIIQTFGNKLRVRVSGVLIENESVLLIKHKTLPPVNNFWSPPGGGLSYNETLKDCLEREFFEETNLSIKSAELICMNEFLQAPLHAIELFFLVSSYEGELKLGKDPELAHNKQIIEELEFIPFSQLKKFPKASYHPIFHDLDQLEDFRYRKSIIR